MSSASYQSSTSPRRRFGALLLALAIELIIALALLSLGVFEPKKPKIDSKLEVFDVQPTLSSKKAATREKTKKTARQASAAAPTVPVPPVKPSKPKPATLGPPQMIVLDREQFAASDIGKLPAQPNDGDDDGGAGSGDSKAAYGPGQGPGGQPIFDVAWYREPTHAELAGYLPRGAPPDSYALIACRMVENYHVENCQALGESPPGSGLARAMRQAAWQFLVRPPRVGNKVKLGTWVRIRIAFN